MTTILNQKDPQHNQRPCPTPPLSRISTVDHNQCLLHDAMLTEQAFDETPKPQRVLLRLSVEHFMIDQCRTFSLRDKP